MFVLLFSGFGTFPAQGKMRMVCRTFAILTLTCYFILNKMMLDLTGKGMFQRGVNHGWYCLWCTSYMLLWCPNGAVLCKVALQESILFYKQLELDNSPHIWFYTQDFQGSELLNGCLGLVVWPNVFHGIFNMCHWYTVNL